MSALGCCLSMISAQTLRVCREVKPLHTFPDHALSSAAELRIELAPHRLFDMAAGDADVAQLTIVHRSQRFDRFPAYPIRGKAIGQIAEHTGETAKGGCGSSFCSRVDRGHFS